jgi:hypothetical protein
LRKISKQKIENNEKYESIYEFDNECDFLGRYRKYMCFHWFEHYAKGNFLSSSMAKTYQIPTSLNTTQ